MRGGSQTQRVVISHSRGWATNVEQITERVWVRLVGWKYSVDAGMFGKQMLYQLSYSRSPSF